LALGDPQLGAVVGTAFAAGRIVPVVALAPVLESSAGARVASAMAERPSILRSLRGAAAATATAAALVLGLGGAPSRAAEPVEPTVFAGGATDPSADGQALAWQAQGGGAFVRTPEQGTRRLPGADPAVGGGRVAWRTGDTIQIAPLPTLEPERSFAAPGAEETALSAGTLVWRDRDGEGRQRILAADTAGEGPTRVLSTSVSASWDLGRPSIDGAVLAYQLITPRSSRIVVLDLGTGVRRDIVAPTGTLLLQPTIRGDSLLYVRSSATRQQLLLESLAAGTRTELWSTEPTARRDAGRERGHKRHRAGYPGMTPPPQPARPAPGVVVTLWSTALGADAAYVTRLRHYGASRTRADIVELPFR
jgi:hypothetical protein